MQLCGLSTLALVSFALASCQGSPPEKAAQTSTDAATSRPKDGGAPAGRAEPYLDLARTLLEAPPGDWERPWRRLQAAGSTAVPALLRALGENPHGTGAQAAVHLLGQLGTEPARDWLQKTAASSLTTTTTVATEAALALGHFAAEESTTNALKDLVLAGDTHITTRAAAAASLVRLGHGKPIASFLEAVFLAASPYAQPSSRKHKIAATKTRWAHERYMIIEALRARFDGEDFGLDEDAPWPVLRDAAARMVQRIAADR